MYTSDDVPFRTVPGPLPRRLGRLGIPAVGGTGRLLERVHAVLRRIPEVVAFGLAPETMGGWGG